MGNPEPGLVDLLVPVEEQIEVESPRSLSRNAAAVAAKRLLDLEQRNQQGSRREAGFELDDPVEEAWLVDVADGVGVPQGRHPHNGRLREAAETADGGSERSLAVAEVRAEADED